MNLSKNPFNIEDNLEPEEKKDILECPNCNFFNVFEYINPKDINYPEWEAKKDYETNHGPKYARLRIKDAIIYSKRLFIHPDKVFDKFTSAYFAAWSWDACTEIALDNLRLKCKSCGFNMEYLKFEYIGNQNENSK